VLCRVSLCSPLLYSDVLKSLFSSGWQCTTSRMLLLPSYDRNRQRCSTCRTNTNYIPEMLKKKYLCVRCFYFLVKSILFLLIFDKNRDKIISVDYLGESDWDPSASFMLKTRFYWLNSKICTAAYRSVLCVTSGFHQSVDASGALWVFYVA
jgi:hypothetical protein